MIFIPEGEFIMGSKYDENYNEQPERKVFVDAFYIDKCPVTNSGYKKFVDATGHRVPYIQRPWAEKYNWKGGMYPSGTENYPVIMVSWNDAVAYATWADKRLPTEAEWEKAARGTNGRIWPWGNMWDEGKAASKRCGSLMNVGSFEQGKSPFGCYDMAGNVWEWTVDWYDEETYQRCSSVNPAGPDTGTFRVLRGGSWIHEESACRCAKRFFKEPEYADNYIGFRCVRSA